MVNLLTNLYFVRHAHSTYTPDELGRPLSKKGFADAEIVSEILEKENIDFVISSPYKRAIQTVNKLAQTIGKDMIIENIFRERKLSGEPVENFNTAIMKVWKDANFSWEGGESNIIAQARGVGATLKILKKYEGKNIVVGTHGNLMVLMMNYFDPNYDFHFWKNLDMPDIYKLTFKGDKLKKVHRLWNRI